MSLYGDMLLLSRVRGPLVTAGFLVAVSFVFVRVDHCVVLQGLYLCTSVVWFSLSIMLFICYLQSAQ